MPILTHKFSKESAANAFFQKLRQKGFRPWIIRKRKGLKISHIVQYQR
jgi:hypothetical protein